MKVYTDLDHLPTFSNPVITIGTFDGVHFGHRKIIEILVHEAKKINGQSIIITFDKHPRLVLNPQDTSLKLINTLSEKIKVLETLGIDILVIVPFTPAFAKQSADAYVKDFLVNKFHPHTIVIGHDHHFGNNREGNFIFLEKEKIKYQYNLIEIPSQWLHEITVSSTQIRNYISNGNVQEANELLEYNYNISGKVVKGNQLGRTIGYPTANILVQEPLKLIPQKGVYAVQVLFKKKLYNAMLNIGNKPTIDANLALNIEVHIFAFDQEIYDEEIELFFIKKLREEKKFANLQDLQAQLHADKIEASTILSLSNY